MTDHTKAAPSAQQAAGSIDTDPQYKRMLWMVAQDWTRTDRHIALACYIERWADSRLAATPAQPIAASGDPLPGFVPAFVRLDGAIFDGTPPISHHTVSNGPSLHVDLMGRRVSQVAQPSAPPKVHFMWSSLFTNTATGIRFALSAADRSDFDLMAEELLKSPEIDTAKVYEIAVLKRADYESLATPVAQPIAVSAPTDEREAEHERFEAALMKDAPLLPRNRQQTITGEPGCYVSAGTQHRWNGWMMARAAAPVSGPTDA